MGEFLSRRSILAVAGVGITGLRPWSAAAQGNGLLDKLRRDKLVRVGLTNGPPYASVNPDGSVDGVAPTLTRLVMERLGVPKVEGIVGNYGQMIPGLLAGRWDIIAADLAVTKARCEQVVFTDPFTSDHAAFAYIPGFVKDPPRSIKETGTKGVKIGMISGTYMQPAVQAAQSTPNNITFFPDSPTLMEGLAARRVDIAFSGILVLREQRAQRNNSFEIVYPMPDDPLHPSGGAFRPGDTDLIEAFKVEYRKLKASGEAEKVVKGFGFDVFSGHLEMTAEQACRDSPV